MTAEEQRTRLIGEIARVLRDGPVPEEARSAALTLIGWLARRMPGEPVSVCDLTRCTGLQEALSRVSGRDEALVDAHPLSEWARTDDPPVSTVNGLGHAGSSMGLRPAEPGSAPYPDAGQAVVPAEAPLTRRSRSAR
jgi:hypothetical protein